MIIILYQLLRWINPHLQTNSCDFFLSVVMGCCEVVCHMMIGDANEMLLLGVEVIRRSSSCLIFVLCMFVGWCVR